MSSANPADQHTAKPHDVATPNGYFDADSSFFAARPAQPANPTHDRTEEVEPVDDISTGVARSAVKRSQTDVVPSAAAKPIKRNDSAPFTTDSSLSRTLTGTSTGRARATSINRNKNKPFVSGLKRSVTAGSLNHTRSQAYSFAFDPMYSDSDSSSSDEDSPFKRKNVAIQEAEKHTKKEKKHDRKQAKKGLSYSQFKLTSDHMRTSGKVSKRDGRLNIAINDTSNRGYVTKALGHTIRHHLDVPQRKNVSAPWRRYSHDHPRRKNKDATSITDELPPFATRPKLNIVIMVIGSRGDIQPFLKVGKILKQKYGHRVRVATHPAFRDFVQKDAGLEFFSVGGDPAQLMAFMVKNPGLIPSVSTLREGEIGRRRDQMAEMMDGFWRACINATDEEEDPKNKNLLENSHPFVADAIIANPPSFAHVHIAERLGIPLHMMFTFPYSPTTQFPHPLANIKPNKSNVDTHYVNFMSYALVEMMTWQGLGDLVNDLRTKTLGLEPVSSLWAPGALYRMHVSYTYMWSPSLVPKPADWGSEIDLAGFVFLDLASTYEPPKELAEFLDAGEPPVYIGFGSIVVDEPEKFTEMIFKAVEMAGVRAIINKGWGGFGGDGKDVPKNVHMINNVPHDWLFPRMKAVIHHGGAGTTAIGLKCGKPTMIVPFFGDQPFWGSMVAEAKAGAFECIPYKKLTVERFAEGIKQCLTEEAQENVQRIAESIEKEGDGAENAVRSFHRSLPLAGRHNMRCSILEDRVAVWKVRGSELRLSALAAQLLVEAGKIKWHDLKLIRLYEWNDFDGPGEPITGSTAAVTGSLYNIGQGVGMVPVRIAKHIKKRDAHEKKKQAIAERKAKKAQNTQSETSETAEARPEANRQETTNTLASTISADPTEPLYQELANDAAVGIAKSGYALINLPLNLTLAAAQGFHNAPRLYGDATVRRPLKVTGIKSGFKAAGSELGYGVYDAWTGVVTQPIGGWQDETTVSAKFVGLGKGAAKGAGGFVLKNITAILAPPVFVGLGFRRWFEKRIGGPGASTFIKQSRVTQGVLDERAVKEEEGEAKLASIQKEVDEGWHIFEEIWAEGQQIKSSSGMRPIGHVKAQRERKQWIENGLVENVRTAKQALDARRNGQDLDKLIAKRRQEMEEAEEPYDEPVIEAEKREEEGEMEPSKESASLMPQTTRSFEKPDFDRHDSDATAVETSPAEKEGKGNGKLSEAPSKLNDVKMDKGIQHNTGIAGAGMVSV